MKLLRLKYSEENKEPFRSIQPGFEIEFNPRLDIQGIEPIGLAGLNGSGKSNLLELISEIFYYLDSLQLDFPSSKIKETKQYSFEIDYAVHSSNFHGFNNKNKAMVFSSNAPYFIVRIIKQSKNQPSYMFTSVISYYSPKLQRQNNNNSQSTIDWQNMSLSNPNITYLLPKFIVAYTSGQNELLSNAYYRMQFHYFNDYSIQLKQASKFQMERSRLFFSDNNSNASVFISNYILGNPEALDIIKTVVKIDRLHSFRITIRFCDYKNDEIIFNQDLERRIELLRRCSTSWIERGKGSKRILTIDYFVDDSTKEAFRKNFGVSPFDLYKTLYELGMMNFYTIPKDTLEMVSNGPKWLNISDELPKVNPDDLVFRIEKIKIIKDGTQNSFYYKGLSDGEHQFLQVVGLIMMIEEIGCLFLLDEPDTHFNTVWRSKLISTINEVVKYYADPDNAKQRLQEIIITTHSPFILSDLKKKNVFVFKKMQNKLSFEQSPIETYGTSAWIILDEIFGKVNSISDMAKEELDNMLGNIDSMNELKAVVQKLNSQYGESVEKFDLFSKLRKLKEKFENQV